MNPTEFNYEKIGFDVFMEKEGGLLGAPDLVDLGGEIGEEVKTAIEETVKEKCEQPIVEGQNLENLRINTWIKSRSYSPKVRGFMIDGRTGFIECADLRVRGTGEIGGWNIDATRIYSDGDEIVLDSANKKITVGSGGAIESDNYVSGYAGSGFHIDENLGEFGNIACRGLIRTSVFQKDVISTVGGNLMVLDGDVLDVDMDATDAETLTTKGTTTFSVNDILRIKDGISDEWLKVTAVNGNTYTVERDKDTVYAVDTNPAWKKGATVVNYGQSGDGGIFMTASEANAPYLSVFSHAGSPWTDLTERLRLGNLNGYPGESSDLYGIKIGDVNNYFKYDSTDGMIVQGGKIRTGTSGERIMIEGDSIIACDSIGNVRVAADNGMWMFWDDNEIGCGAIFGALGNLYMTSLNADILLNANSGANAVDILGNVTPNYDATYDLGTRPYKWNILYLHDKLRFDYVNTNHISVIDDADNAYTRIRFDAENGNIGLGRTTYPTTDATYSLGNRLYKWNRAYLEDSLRYNYATENKIEKIDDSDILYTRILFGASGGNIGFGRTIYPISHDSYNLGTSDSAGRWNTLYTYQICLNGTCRTSWPSASGANTSLSNLSSVEINTALLPSGTISLGSSTAKWSTLRLSSNIYFYTTDSKGLIWDSAGDNAQFYYNNTSNYFVINKQFNANYNKIIHLTTPTANYDAATKKYVDDNVGGSGANTALSNLTSPTSINQHLTPSSTADCKYCGTTSSYWRNVYSHYIRYKVTPSSFDKYDDLQILRDLKIKGEKIDMKSMPKEVYDKDGFTSLGDLNGFNLCASKKIVECVDDLKEEIDKLKNKLKLIESKI